MRLRFAPSPTGSLHVGNARTALFNWLFARSSGATFILRIEDTDSERSTRESERGIIEDLRWLGLEWDEGIERGGDVGPYRQSERLPIYRAHAAELIQKGHAYRCFCSPDQLEADKQAQLAQGRAPMYVGRCRDLAPEAVRRRVDAGDPSVIRFRVLPGADVVFTDLVRGDVRFETDIIGDPILVRSDGFPAYNFAVVVDDATMGITHVVRGEDHISNTPRQVLLYRAFGWAMPEFAHVSLVLGPDHAPLSKRHGAASVSEFRERGYLPEALVNYLALLGWSPGENQELMPLEELTRRFRLSEVGRSAGVFDLEKLAWVNRHYLKAASHDRLVALAVPFLQREGWVGDVAAGDREYLLSIVPAAATSVDRLDQVPRRLQFLFDYSAARALASPEIHAEADDARPVCAALAEELTATGPLLDRESFRSLVGRVRERTGRKGKALLHPIRVVLTGESEGLELDIAVPAIDRGAGLWNQPGRSGVVPITSSRDRALDFQRALGTGKAGLEQG